MNGKIGLNGRLGLNGKIGLKEIRLILFNNGYINPITGGFGGYVLYGSAGVGTFSVGTTIVVKNKTGVTSNNHMYIGTTNFLDMTGYKKMIVTLSTSAQAFPVLRVCDVAGLQSPYPTQGLGVVGTRGFSGDLELDISSYTGSHLFYVGVIAGDGGDTVTVTNIRLTK